MTKLPFNKNLLDTYTPAEIGEMLLAIEKRDLELFGKHPSGKRLLNMSNPYVKKFVNAAQKSKGFGGGR